jgi:hypothetical protein
MKSRVGVIPHFDRVDVRHEALAAAPKLAEGVMEN